MNRTHITLDTYWTGIHGRDIPSDTHPYFNEKRIDEIVDTRSDGTHVPKGRLNIVFLDGSELEVPSRTVMIELRHKLEYQEELPPGTRIFDCRLDSTLYASVHQAPGEHPVITVHSAAEYGEGKRENRYIQAMRGAAFYLEYNDETSAFIVLKEAYNDVRYHIKEEKKGEW